ncbi:unnamed protein product [Adineta steineri]|uniref:Uncharacterized protein n=2 Tax=Adineta steineri TaxID=433720 RepID=A0A814YZB5_9BILA|nr:unnamed protein product [Adineta steineri]
MHVTLLRHTRVIVQQIYSSLSPSRRVKFDASLRTQKFPHFFMVKPTGSTAQYFRTIAEGIYGGSSTAIDTKKRKTKEEKFRKQFRLTKHQV